MTDHALFSAPAERNSAPILEVLKRVLPPSGLVLEIASGTGQHAAYMSRALPSLTWQPSDPEAHARASIAAHAAQAGLPNMRPPLEVDVRAAGWPIEHAEAIVCINMIHISPWSATLGLFAGARRLLPADAPLFLYGPYRKDGEHTAPSNAAFDRSLRAQNAEWGVRDLEAVVEAADRAGFTLVETVAMPANNLSVVFRKRHDEEPPSSRLDRP